MTTSSSFFERFGVDNIFIIIIVVAIIGIGATFIPATQTNLTPALIAVNLILIIFYYAQWRNTTRPVLSLALIGFDRYGEFDPQKIPEPCVLEECQNGAYILLSNISNNIASTVSIEFLISSQLGHITGKGKRVLSYLNPYETARILVPFNEIIEAYHDHFTTVEDGSATLAIPKDTLYIDMIVNVTYGTIPQYSINDTYLIEWTGKSSSPKLSTQILSWNIRNDLPIFKGKNE